MREYLSSAADVLREQGSDGQAGLASGVAAERLANNGPNKLREQAKTPLWIRFFQQMADPMVIMLIVAAVISAVTGAIQGEIDFADVIIIMTVVIINSALGVIQEAKSEEALAALQEMSAAQSKVMRDGKLVMLHSSELVVGDVVLLEAGDSVPADCRVLESATMKIEEAALTGESVPVEKRAEAIELAPGADDVPLGDRKNMCYMGSTVVYGRGRAIVVATGMDTEMGKIAGALTEAKEELTPLQVKLDELSRILTKLVIVICVVIFAVDVVRHGFGNMAEEPALLLNTFMVAVSLAVAAIPEGLVAVVTIVLSLGVTKMARRQAIIRNLSAGSFAKRYGVEEGIVFDAPTIEFSYKNDELGDPLLNSYHALALKLATAEEIETIKKYAFAVNDILKAFWAECGVTLVDFKLEFGRLTDGTIVLADEISPDTCRLWDEKTHEKLDKDRFRRDLGGVEGAYAEVMQRLLAHDAD